jgi:hypothetical protein
MKLLLNLKILVGLGWFLPLCRYVLQNHLVRYISAARCKVPSGPQMSAPKLPTQVRELHQQLVTGLALQVLHHLAHRQIGRHRHKQMDMVFAHMPFNYLNIIHPTDLSHQFAHPRPNRPTQHRPAVFGDPNQVVLQIVFRVTRRPIYLHMDVLPQGFA